MENQINREKLRQLVDRYCVTLRHPNLPRFNFHDLDLKDGWYRKPQSYKPGCYALFSADGELLYIGKASHKASVGNRLAAHFYNKASDLAMQTAYVQIIEVSEPFEAPSLEEYLIREVRPRLNTHGIYL